jgi:hypothetical protein
VTKLFSVPVQQSHKVNLQCSVGLPICIVEGLFILCILSQNLLEFLAVVLQYCALYFSYTHIYITSWRSELALLRKYKMNYLIFPPFTLIASPLLPGGETLYWAPLMKCVTQSHYYKLYFCHIHSSAVYRVFIKSVLRLLKLIRYYTNLTDTVTINYSQLTPLH